MSALSFLSLFLPLSSMQPPAGGFISPAQSLRACFSESVSSVSDSAAKSRDSTVQNIDCLNENGHWAKGHGLWEKSSFTGTRKWVKGDKEPGASVMIDKGTQGGSGTAARISISSGSCAHVMYWNLHPSSGTVEADEEPHCYVVERRFLSGWVVQTPQRRRRLIRIRLFPVSVVCLPSRALRFFFLILPVSPPSPQTLVFHPIESPSLSDHAEQEF